MIYVENVNLDKSRFKKLISFKLGFNIFYFIFY